MAIDHRKLLSEQDSNQTSTCSDCGPTCPYKCSYPEIFWPPQPSPQPPHTTTDGATTIHISPYVIIIVALLASAFLFISYYLIMVRCCTRFRRPPTTQVYSEPDDFSDEEHGFEVDHPIWHITTVGLQPSVINSIAVIKFNKGDNLIDGTDCSVCLSEFDDDETLRLLPKCNHAFHIPCIDMWLRSHTNCPLCRAGIMSNTLSAVLSPNDQSFSRENGSNRNTQVDNSENNAEFDGNRVSESEICEDIEDSKTEYESVMGARRSISMDSVVVADIVLAEIKEDSGDAARLSRPQSAEEIQEHEEYMGGG